jgi:hypothetical protein
MSMKTDELRSLYRGYIDGQGPSRRRRCLGPKDWKDLFDPRTSEALKGRLVEHVTRCPDCVRKFELFLEMERAKNGLAEAVGGLVGETRGAAPSALRASGTGIVRTFRWRFAAAFAALAVASLTLVVLLTKDRSVPLSPDVTRGDQIVEIKLLKPLDQVKKKGSLEFAWASPLRLENYRVDVYDDALVLLGQSPPVSQTRWTLPREILDTLEYSKRYIWMVSGSQPSGERIESPFGTFKLVK